MTELCPAVPTWKLLDWYWSADWRGFPMNHWLTLTVVGDRMVSRFIPEFFTRSATDPKVVLTVTDPAAPFSEN